MENTQLQLIFTGVAATLPTLTVLAGMLQNHFRFNALDNRFNALDKRIDELEVCISPKART